MARTIKNAVSLKLFGRKYRMTFTVPEMSEFSREDLEILSRRGYMASVTALIRRYFVKEVPALALQEKQREDALTAAKGVTLNGATLSEAAQETFLKQFFMLQGIPWEAPTLKSHWEFSVKELIETKPDPDPDTDEDDSDETSESTETTPTETTAESETVPAVETEAEKPSKGKPRK